MPLNLTPISAAARPIRFALVAAGLLFAALASPAADRAKEGLVTRQDLEIVECLLPGQVRQLGRSTFLSPRRPVRTTTADCRIRGGEFVAYDRADYQSALRFWMQSAEAGDPEAQTNVGEIYERGLGAEPLYEAAVIWYQKAADQGYSRALFNLGTLYEQGHGVPADRLAALNLYRQAWGLPADSLMYESAARREQQALRAELDQVITDKDQQIALLAKQLGQMERELNAADTKAADASRLSGEVRSLRELVGRLESERRATQVQLTALPPAAVTPPSPPVVATNTVTTQTRGPTAAAAAAGPAMPPAATIREFRGMSFGRYYALIIGNQKYQQLDDLQTPRADAERAARLLKDKYGFTVQMVSDADDVAMLKALNDLNQVVKPEDNVLIYYAGHGTRLPAGRSEVGYWMPVNAERPPRDTFWLPNEQVTAHLARLAAKRVLVVADSCYAGLLSTDPSVNMFGTEENVTLDYVRYKLPKRARLLLASGGDDPVLDSDGQGSSVFSRAFLDVLRDNNGILSSPSLYAKVRARVQASAGKGGFKQVPDLKSIKSAGHEVGDFFFVPKGG